MFTPTLHTHSLCYTTLFQELNLSFGCDKVGLVGRNGCGKTTLLKLLSGELAPTNGSIERQASIHTLTQDFSHHYNGTVADVLDIEAILQALTRIAVGSTDTNDFTIVGDNWLIGDKALTLLSKYNLGHLSFEQPISHLSGGEQTRLHLLRAFMHKTDFILLDEPTNNLDSHAREILYQMIDDFNGGVIIASHDRALLRKMDKIIELNNLGAIAYGGNYDHYLEQKQLAQQAAQQTLHSEMLILKKSKSTIQERMEKHQRNEAKGGRVYGYPNSPINGARHLFN